MKNQTSTLIAAYAMARRTRNVLTTLLAGTFVTAQVTPSFASIDNTAQATGTYNALPAPTNSSSASVPVAAAAPAMTVAKTAAAPTTTVRADGNHTEAGDTITYTYVVTNTGNVTMNSVVPVDLGTTFGGSASTGSLGAFSPASATIVPGANQTFTAVYALTTLDVYHGAGLAGSNLVSDSAVAQGTYGPGPILFTIPNGSKSTATTTIVGFALLAIAKTKVLTDIVAPGNTALKADVGETITYTYTIANNGTVPITAVSPSDIHDNGPGGSSTPVGLGAPLGITGETVSIVGPLGGGASTNTTANDGIIDKLAPGATATFTWAHVVTQAEFNHG